MSNPNGPTPLETANGSAQVEIKYANGQVETVTVRQLPMRQMGAFADAIKDPASVIALCVGRKLEWTDALTPEAFAALLGECDRLNEDFFLRFSALQKARMTKYDQRIRDAGLVPADFPS